MLLHLRFNLLRNKFKMKTIERLLRLSGGLNELDCFERVFVYKKPYLPIYVRYLGTGPRDYPLIAVGQFFYKKEGEELESEVTFEIDTSTADQWGWYPVSFRLGDPPMSHGESLDFSLGEAQCPPKFCECFSAFARGHVNNLPRVQINYHGAVFFGFAEVNLVDGQAFELLEAGMADLFFEPSFDDVFNGVPTGLQ